MHKYAFLEPEQRCARIAVVFILVFCVFDILPGHRIFQLCGGDRKSVERERTASMLCSLPGLNLTWRVTRKMFCLYAAMVSEVMPLAERQAARTKVFPKHLKPWRKT